MPTTETTLLLAASRRGEGRAADQLFAHLYDELRRLSQARIRSKGPVTISATGLVHEAYIKLIGSAEAKDRAHFLALASRAMRQILTDHARARGRQKRGGADRPITLQTDLVVEKAT